MQNMYKNMLDYSNNQGNSKNELHFQTYQTGKNTDIWPRMWESMNSHLILDDSLN